MSRSSSQKRTTARARVMEAAARMVGLLREGDDRASRRPTGAEPPAAESALRWCLFTEAVADRISDPQAARHPAPGIGERARFAWARSTDRYSEDPAWTARSDPGGLSPPLAGLRERIGAAAAHALRMIDDEAAGGFRRRALHAAYGPLDAADWAELLLVFAADLERRALRAGL